ncbi:hypothetical protein VTP01DRAFT_1583 [Rhizomucor pusillus]|uniref:uncharacterized protein n=1 Tax=Rhizomucor pusillus TaxID=4840 RepID=UPI003744A9DF
MPAFGGAPSCPRCHKAVYMAEQTTGPGGAWHRACLTCKECNKRLDSTTLTERQGEAYCKICYNRKWGPKGYGFASGAAFLNTENKMPNEILREQQLDRSPPTPAAAAATATSTSPSPPAPPTLPARPQQPSSSPALPPRKPEEPMTSFWSSKPAIPPKPATTTPASKPAYLNTSYVPKKVNIQVQNDTCTKCGKAVYAAEMAMGAGNKYHKFCLKCSQCGKLLNSTNMVDKDFDLYCRGCYAQSFGPKGFGYGNLLTPQGATR